jgi:predicted membrane-bound spermidine synthase
MPTAVRTKRYRQITAADAGTSPAHLLILYGLMVASGAAGLIYQVLWVKQLSLVVGVHVYAVTTAISAFFAGLALGGLWFGRFADRLSRPLRLYAMLELTVGGLGIGATYAFPQSAQWFARLEDTAGLLAWLLPFLIVGLPAFFMGGTLPVMVRALGPGSGRVGVAGGRLYAANTAGAIAGTLLSAFLLIPAHGVLGSAVFAACLNLLAALGTALLKPQAGTQGDTEKIHAEPKPGAHLAIALYALAGAVALGYEVVWTQSIVQFMSTRAYAFAVVLATYLAGLVLGSALYARRSDRLVDPWGWFALLITAAGLISLAQMAGLGQWLILAQTRLEFFALELTGSELAGMCARFAVAAVCVVLLPTTLLGAAFPLALRLVVDRTRVGRDVGNIVAANTLGGIGGVTLTGFVLIPAVGLVRTLGILAVIAAGVGIIAVWRGPKVSRKMRVVVISVAALTLATASLLSPSRLADLMPGAGQGRLVFYQEGRAGTVAVIQQGKADRAFNRLYIQGVSNTGDAMPSLRYMRLQALIPLLIHRGTPRSALVIGFGTGITVGAMLRYADMQRPVVAELLPEVLAAAPLFRGSYQAINDPRLDIRLRDGRRELLSNDQRYDVITLEPPPPSATGVVNLYSSDFYRLAAGRLEENGLVAQWLPLPTQNDEDTRSLVRSFLDVFPHASLWTTEFHEMLLVGSQQPIELDVPRIQARFDEPAISQSLREVGIDSAQALLAAWITDQDGLARYASDALPVTDNQPRIEYASWVRPKEITRTLPALLALHRDPPLVNAGQGFKGAVRDKWQQLRLFYGAGLHAYNGNRKAWAEDSRGVMGADGANPYYRWFNGQ